MLSRFLSTVRILLLLFISLPIVAIEFETSAYIKSYLTFQAPVKNEIVRIDNLAQTQTSARIMVSIFNQQQVWEIHYELGYEGNSIELPKITTMSKNTYRFDDLSPNFDAKGKNTFFQNFDRLNVQLQLANYDFTIGRQAITFGSARVINPSDVFLPFDVQVRNTEYRVGVDALRFQKALGELGELDIGYVFGDNATINNSAVYLQWQSSIANKDVRFNIMQFSKQNLVSIGTEFALGSTGIWFETAWVQGDIDYIRTSIGIDYAITENTYALIEYHYNGAGSSAPADYFSNQLQKPYSAGGVFLQGKHYAIPSISWQANALLTFSLLGIYNIEDKSLFANFGANLSLSNNFYAGADIYIFTGDDFFLRDNGSNLLATPSFGSEYGGNPNSFTVNISYYF